MSLPRSNALRLNPSAVHLIARSAIAGSILGCSIIGCSAAPSGDPFETMGGLGPSGSAGAAGQSQAGSNGLGAGGTGSSSSNGASGSTGVVSIGGAGSGASLGGSGGSLGSAGNGSAVAGSGGQGSGGTGASAGPCEGAGIFLCDDFEAAALNVFPNAAHWLANDCQTHVVDAMVPAHSGAQSLKGVNNYPACMVHADVTAQQDIYVRSWIRLGAASSESGHHVGLLEFGPAFSDDPELRVGIRDGGDACSPSYTNGPGVDVTVGGLAMGERTSCSGVALDPDRWYCFAVHLQRQADSVTFSVDIDGSAVVPETTHTGLNAEWNQGSFYFKLGRSSYGGNNEWPVWHDDVALSTSPLPCP